MNIKQTLLTTPFGKLAITTRDKVALFKIALTRPEALGTLINDQMATLLVTQLCDYNKTFIDVGAHIGSIISEVSNHSKTIKIIAIEAIPDKAMKLRQKFPAVEVHQCAVGNQEGEVSFYINTQQSGYSSLIKPSENLNSTSVKISVLITRLDRLVSSDNIDVIKIDVEGSELEVLSGSENIIKNNRPVLMFESALPKENNWIDGKKKMWSLLASHNYEVVFPNRVAHNCPGLSQDTFIESHYYPRLTTNYFGIPVERRTEIRDKARTILKIHVN